ncbi:MAG TPA: FecR domain-containing protein [Candidatus Binatia bacterium]|nr:FecR domain-containing protein [Candidatus Binatia bacterium]
MTVSQRSLGVIALVAFAAASPAANAQPARVGVVTTVHGEAMLSRASLSEPTALKRRDDLFVADRITTGDQSFTRLLLGGKALVTVRERSSLTITEAPGSSVVDVASGGVAVAVAKERMQRGETVEIRTPNAVAGIRGTVVIAEVAGAPGQETTTITVLRGLVEVRPLDGVTRHPVGPGLHVGAAQMVRVSSLAPAARPVPTPVQPLTPDVRQRLNEAWKGNLGDSPSGTPPTIVETQKREAAAQVQRVLERRDEEGRKSHAAGSAGQDTSGVLAGPRLSGGGSGSGSSGATPSGGSSSLTSSGSTLVSGSGSSLTSSGSSGSGGSSGSSSLSSGGSSGSNSGSNSGSGLGLTRILDSLLRKK